MTAGSQSTGTGTAPPAKGGGIDWGKISLVLILFAVLFSGTALVFSVESTGKAQRVQANKVYGPFQIRRANQLVTFELVHFSPRESWAYIEGEILNAEKKTIMRFGGNYYHESGYDGGRWVERQKEQTVVARFPKPGQYYMKFSVETGAKYSRKGIDTTPEATLTIRRTQHLGGSGMLDYIAIFLILLAFGFLIFNNRAKIEVVRS